MSLTQHSTMTSNRPCKVLSWPWSWMSPTLTLLTLPALLPSSRNIGPSLMCMGHSHLCAAINMWLTPWMLNNNYAQEHHRLSKIWSYLSDTWGPMAVHSPPWVQTDCQVRGTEGLILDLILLKIQNVFSIPTGYFSENTICIFMIHWRWQIRHIVHGIPTQDQRILSKTKSRSSQKVHRVPMYRNSTCWHILIFKCSLLNHSLSNYQNPYHFLLSLPCVTAHDIE